MKRIMLVLLALAGISLNAALAGSCGYRSYSSYSYTPSYGYSSSYGNNSYYWPGGYWPGGGGYSAGYYKAGHYANYGYNNYYEQPYFVKYQAVIPLVSLPTYGAYYQEPPPAAAPACTMHTPAAAAPAAPAAATYPTGAAPAADGKLDRILLLTEQTSGRLTRVEARLDVLEGRRSPAPELATRPPATTPPAAAPAPAEPPAETEDVMVAGPNILHTRCAGCHDEKKVATARSKVALFVTGPDGPELAARDAKSVIVALNPAVLKKCRDLVLRKEMPPQKDHAGLLVSPMSDKERKTVDAFFDKVLAQPPTPGAGGTK